MRIAATLTVLLGMTVAASAQSSAAPRFNVLYNERFFPQTTPKATLASLIKAAELGQFDYVAAYLMDEKAADGIIAERAKDVAGKVESEFRERRTKERADPF